MKIVISFDFELGWGVADSLEWLQRERSGLYEACQERLPYYIDFLAKNEAPATWAIVSGLLHDELPADYSEHLSGDYKSSIDYFIANAKKSTRYALPLVKKISRYNANEIATHSATHPYAQHQDVNEKSYVDDVRKSIFDIEHYLQVKPERIVFPRDDSTFLKAVSGDLKLGGRVNPNLLRARQGKASSYISGFLSGPDRSQTIMTASGMYFHSGSLLFNWFGGRAAFMKKHYTKMMLKRILNRSQDLRFKEDVYHIWLHPFNLIREPEVGRAFIDFVETGCQLRKKGCLDFFTMRDVEEMIFERSYLHRFMRSES